MLHKFLKAFYEGNEYEPESLSLEDFQLTHGEYSDISKVLYCGICIAVYDRHLRKLHLRPISLNFCYYDDMADEKRADYLTCIHFLNDVFIYGEAKHYF